MKSLVRTITILALLTVFVQASHALTSPDTPTVKGWTVEQGSWTVKGKNLSGSGVSAEIVSTSIFPSDRTFTVTMTTVSAGSQSYYVAWATGKFVDDSDRSIFLIHTDGTLEFTVSQAGLSHFNSLPSTLSPFTPHKIQLTYLGNEGKASVDGVQYFDLTDPFIGALGNSPVQLVSWGPSSSTFSSPTVT